MKQKRLRLKPAVRDKRRYFLIEKKNMPFIEDAILSYVGVLGLANSAYLPVKEKSSSYGIGSCLRDSLEIVRAGLGLKGIQILKVSSTIKGLKE